MNIFQRIGRWLSGMFTKKNIENAFNVQVAVTPLMQSRQAFYRQITRGNAPWNDGDTPSLMLASSVSAEVARKVTMALESEVFGGESEFVDDQGEKRKEKTTNPRAEYLNEQYARFKDKLRNAVVAACNSGEVIFKPYLRNGGLEVIVSDTDCYYPVEYNTCNELTDVIFSASLQRDKWQYRLLERHTYNESAQTHTIVYRAYKRELTDQGYTTDELGRETPLTDVQEWAHLRDMTINGIGKPLYSLFRIPSSDNVETPQRQGLPIWSKAVQKFKEADTQNRYLRREYYLGRARIMASVDLFGVSETQTSYETNPRKQSNIKQMEFAPDDKDIFVMMGDGPESVPILPFTPELRFDPLNAEMNRIKRDIEFMCGLSYGVLSDANIQEKTATEVMSSKDRFFTTVSDIQQALQKSIVHLVDSFNVLAELQGVPQGEYDISFTWDDSIIADRQREYDERIRLMQMGVISAEEMRAWYFGVDVDSEEARKVPKPLESEF